MSIISTIKNNGNRILSLFLMLLLSVNSIWAQQATIKGKVLDHHGKGIPDAVVIVKKDATFQESLTGLEGNFEIANLDTGNHHIHIAITGFKDYNHTVYLLVGQALQHDCHMKEDEIHNLDDVIIESKSEAQKKSEEPIIVEVIDVKKTVERANSLPQLINQTSGVKVRESTGVGSNLEVNINGLQGNAIRFFKDGIPTDYLGRSSQLNLIPTGSISNVEIYKGVLPIDLGADALGGAINITTKGQHKNHVTATYELGSFNTHIGTVNTNHIIPKTKVFVGTSSYAIYSKNNYPFDAPVRDLESQQSSSLRLRRFHDAINSQFIQINFGLQNTKFADLLKFELAYFNYYKQLQNGVFIDEVFGEARNLEKNKILSLTYEKHIKDKLLLKAFGAYSRRNEKLIDKSNYNYDWYGHVTNPDEPQLVSGEIRDPKTDQNLDMNVFTGRVYSQYDYSKKINFKISSTISSQDRVGTDPYSAPNPLTGIQPITLPNYFTKVISGIGTGFKLFNDRIHNELTFKHFYLDVTSTDLWRYGQVGNQQHDAYGIGNSIKYVFNNTSHIRLSFENTTRIPEALEYFGDNVFVLGNPDLKPEKSKNINLSLHTNLNRAKSLLMDINLFYRNTENFVRVVPFGFIFARYENTDAQLTKGIETAFKLNLPKGYKFNLSVTYQDMRRAKSGNALEGSRTTNVPYFFTNLNAAKEFKKPFKLNVDGELYTSYFFTEQYLLYPTTKKLEPALFERDLAFTDLIIPAQNQLDMGLTVKLHRIPLNINVQVNNILNSRLYDQFRIQKPPRHFRIKLTYKF